MMQGYSRTQYLNGPKMCRNEVGLLIRAGEFKSPGLAGMCGQSTKLKMTKYGSVKRILPKFNIHKVYKYYPALVTTCEITLL
jgi:hypothetical protein